jgi:hypothetical protein
MFYLVVALFLFFFIPFLFLLLFLTELLWNVPGGVVGCMRGVGGSSPSLPVVKKSAVVSSFLLYAKPQPQLCLSQWIFFSNNRQVTEYVKDVFHIFSVSQGEWRVSTLRSPRPLADTSLRQGCTISRHLYFTILCAT